MTETVVSAALQNSGLTDGPDGRRGRIVIYVTADGKDEAFIRRLYSCLDRPPHPCPVSPAALTVRYAIETMGAGGNVCHRAWSGTRRQDGPLRDILRLHEDMKAALRKLEVPGQPGRQNAPE